MKTVHHLTKEEVIQACIQYALGEDLHKYGKGVLDKIEVEVKFDHEKAWPDPDYVKGADVVMPEMAP